LEHVFGKWLMLQLTRESKQAEITLTVGTDEPKKPFVTRGKNIGMKVRDACESCNGGWMAQLESAVQPYILATIRDFAVPFSQQAQRALSTWIAKTAMVIECLAPDDRPKFYTQAERDTVRLKQRPPDATCIWIGRGVQAGWSATVGRTVAFTGEPLTGGLVTTMAIEHLVIQAITIRLTPGHPHVDRANVNFPNLPDPWIGRLVQIWPPRESTIEWPPAYPAARDHAEVEALSRRFELGPNGV
jgi:hypothetical protein